MQLPGVDDPARVKDIMQSTAMLEIRQALGGPYPSEQEAHAGAQRRVPPDTVLMKGTHMRLAAGDAKPTDTYYLITRVFGGKRPRSCATRSRTATRTASPDVNFTLTGDGGKPLLQLSPART